MVMGKGDVDGWFSLFFVLFLVGYGVQCFYGNLVFQRPLVMCLCLLFFIWVNFVQCGWGYTIYLVDIS